MKDLSRRKLLVDMALSAGIALVPGMTKVAVPSNSGQPKTPPIGPLLAVQPISDPNAWAMLDQLFPGFRTTSCFQQLQGACYLVTNVSGKTIKAFSTSWSIPIEGTVQTKLVLHYFRPRGHHKPRMHFGKKGNKTRYTAKIPVLKAGATKLVSPYFAFTPSHYRKAGVSRWQQLLTSRSPSSFPVPPAEFASNPIVIPMSIDAAISRDFYLVGPNKSGLDKILRLTRNAEHDEAVSVWRQIKSGASAAAIKKRLKLHASGLAFEITSKNDLYCRVRQRQAKVLLRRLNHGRWDQFVKTISYLKKKPKTMIKRA